jgi:hypothetical protein
MWGSARLRVRETYWRVLSVVPGDACREDLNMFSFR